MLQAYDGEELIVDWTLLPAEAILVSGKRGPARLGFAILLKFFQHEAQVGIPPEHWSAYDWDGRTIIYHRAEIRTFLGFREATIVDQEALGTWLAAQVLPTTVRPDAILAAAYERLRDLRI